MNTHPRYPLVKVPANVQTVLYLLCEELKSRKLFRSLQDVGLDGSYYQPHLDELILRNLALDEDSDEVFEVYDKIMERRSQKLQPGNNSIVKQALKAYHELQL
jgi:hypothetical protein